MGPALIEPDHLGLGGLHGQHLLAAMGPALIEPDHVAFGALVLLGSLPQWGRLSSSRITWSRRRSATAPTRAAMGPALIEPDHPVVHRVDPDRHLAAMGPALIEPDHASSCRR